MKVKTSELTGISLDYAVALASGATVFQSGDICWFFTLHGNMYTLSNGWGGMSYQPSDNWVIGGPIIEREEIGLRMNLPCSPGRRWEGRPSPLARGAGGKYGYGPTALIAAMRCYVASKLGEEVEIPEELLK